MLYGWTSAPPLRWIIPEQGKGKPSFVCIKTSILAAGRKKQVETIDLISQMTNVVVAKEGVRPSEKKTAVLFLSGYIRNGFETCITEKKPTFPKQITLEAEDWRGVSTDGTNGAALKADFNEKIAAA